MSDTVKLEIIVDDKGSLVVKNFKDVVGKSLRDVAGESGKAGSAVTKLWKDMAIGQLVASGVRSAYVAFVGALKDSAGEYMKAAANDASLRQTLINLGDTYASQFDVLDEYAKRIQQTTVVDDDMAKSLMQIGLNMGIPIKQIGSATEAAIGLTRAFKGMSLDQAMKATAAAFEGNTQKLQRYIPELKETASDTEKLAIVQKAMADGLKIAYNEITTDSGKLQQFRNDCGDLQESIGKLLVEALMPMIAGFKNFFDQNKDLVLGVIRSLITGFTSLVDVIGWVGTQIGKLLALVQRASTIVSSVVGGWRNLLILFTNELSDTYDKLGESIMNETEQLKRSTDRFRDFAKVAGLSGEEIQNVTKGFHDSESGAIQYERALQAIKKGKFGEEMKKQFEVWVEGQKKAAAASSTANSQIQLELKANIQKTQEQIEAEKELEQQRKEAEEYIKKYGLATEGLTEAGRALYFQIMQMVGILPRFTQETHDLAEQQERFGVTTGELTEEGRQMYLQLLQLVGILPQLKTETENNNDATEKWKLNWKDAVAVIEFTKQLVSEISQGLEALGVDLGRNGEAWMGAAEGAATFTQGLITQNPLTIISGAVTMLTGVIKALAGDGIGEAIKRENEWMAINESLEEQLRELADEIGTVHEATSMMLADIIDQSDVTLENFDQFAQRIQQILSNLDRGEMSLAETTFYIGSAFESLIAKAQKLGTEGSASIMTLIDDLKNRGIEVAEINEYIEAQLQAGYEGYKQMRGALSLEGANQAYLDQLAEVQRLQIEAKKTRGPGGMVGVEMTPELEAALKRLEELRGKITDIKDLQKIFGDLNIQVYKDMEAYEKKIAANPELKNAIDGATKALIGLSNAQKLTEDQFDDFGKSAVKAYQELLKKGFSGDEATKSMKTMLQRLQTLKEQYGFSLDPELQKLLDQAIKGGIVVEGAKTDTELYMDMVGYQKTMSESLQKQIPDLLRSLGDSIEGLGVPAAAGYYGVVKGGSNTLFRTGEREDELVSITPLSQMRGGWTAPKTGSDEAPVRRVELNIHIHNPSLTPEQAADAVRIAYTRNARQIRTLLEEGQ